MKTFYQFKKEVLKLHNEIAMKDAINDDAENSLDEACEKLVIVSKILGDLDINGKN